VFRIVVVGDSFTMGSGVRDEETYPSLVEDALNRRGDRVYEVLNLGLIGLNVNGVVDRLTQLGLRFHPDLIVYGCTLNDIKGAGYRVSVTVDGWLIQQGRYARFRASPSYLLRVAWPHWLALHDRLRARPGTSLYELLDNYDHNPRAWAVFLAGLDRLGAVGTAANVPVVVFVHTSLEYLSFLHPYLDIYARIGRAAQERGMRVVQSFPSLRGHEEESLWVSDLDPHPNAAAHQLMASALLNGLETGILPGVQ
jgi:lysophospholipase L1-like esterase